jgi:hypothetical protein
MKRTCLNCNATCCRCLIEYHIEHKEASRNYHTYSQNELKGLGKETITFPDNHKPCHKLVNVLCSREKHKPRLCRTWYCHGKLWQLKIVHSESHKTKIVIERSLKEAWVFCVDCNQYIGFKGYTKGVK